MNIFTKTGVAKIECDGWVKYDDVIAEHGEKCDCCGEIGQDRRTLSMACGYAMNEMNVPFKELPVANIPSFGNGLYTLRVCKDCRANWMHAIRDWFNGGGND